MKLRRAIATLVCVVIGTIMFAPLAGADGGGGAATDGDGIDYGAISGDQQPGTPASAGNGGGSNSPTNCTYTLVQLEAGAPIFDLDGNLIDTSGDGAWYDKQCGTVYFGLVFVPAGAATPVVSPRTLANGVLGRMPIPVPKVRLSPEGDQVVNLPMWTWLDEWAAVTDSANVPGVAVTVTAAPTKAIWTFGDGQSVTCNGPGVPWTAAAGPEPLCGHTFTRSSAAAPNGTYRVTVSVTWTASYTVAGGAGGGNLAPVTRTTTFGIQVGEVQSINTNLGGRR